MKTKGSISIIIASSSLLIALIAGYFVLKMPVTQPFFRSYPKTALTETVPTTNPTDDKTNKATAQEQDVHGVKYFFENIGSPKKEQSVSGKAENVAIQGKLIADKVVLKCVAEPCIQLNPPQYSYSLQDIADKNYVINFRGIENQPLKNLKDGDVYIVSGWLERGINFKKNLVFIFDPVKAIPANN